MDSILNNLMFALPYLFPAFIWFVIILPKIRKTSPEFQEKAKLQARVMTIVSCIFIGLFVFSLLKLIF